MARHPDNEAPPGAVAFRPEGSLLYFNCEHVRESVVDRVREMCPRPNLAVCDLSAAPLLDLAGAEAILDLGEELRTLGTRLCVVEARSPVRDRLRSVGYEERFGRLDRFRTIADALDAGDSDEACHGPP
jgi:MFS superfamily sulfate permease-like transporter